MAPENTTNTIIRSELSPLELLADAVHMMSHDLHAVRLLLERHAGILEGYQRGGLLGARAARKQANGKSGT